jgi:hypothetical protein
LLQTTNQLLDRLKLLMVADSGPETMRERDSNKLIPPLHGALIKNVQGVHLFERLATMRDGRGGDRRLPPVSRA